MPSSELAQKRPFSPLQCTGSPETKKRRIECEKPTLRVDCTVPPRLPPQAISSPSPLQFQFGPCLPYNNAIECPTGFVQHQSHIQQSAAYYGWDRYTGTSTPQWPTTNLPYSVNDEFLDTCKTSVASTYSFFSSISSTQNPFKDSPKMRSLGPQSSLTGRVEVTQDNFVTTTVSRLSKLKETLTAQIEAVEELLKAATLMLGYGGHAVSGT